LLALAAFAWLAPQLPKNPQIVTRLGLTVSIAESGRLDIDRFANRTVDKAQWNGHYYADKTPGLSFLAIPVVAATAYVVNSRGGKLDADDRHDFAFLAKVTTIAVNAVISALAVAILFLTAVRLGASRSGALFGAGSLAFATPFFGWSTAFFAHSVSGSLLIFAAAVVVAFTGGATGQPRPRFWLVGLGLGVILGYAMVVDLTTAPACLLGGGLALTLAARRETATLVKMASGLALGGALGLLPLLVYNQLAFGSVFTLGYSAVVGFEGMQRGFFGITWPSLPVAGELLFGVYRGLLPLSPILLLVPVGLVVMWRKTSTRFAAIAILAVSLSFLWINASYFYWDGGGSAGPRHLVAMLPLSCLALAFAWPRAKWALTVTLVLLAASLVLSLVCAVGGMFPSSSIHNPLLDVLLPKFFQPKNLLTSLPIVLIWGLFALVFLSPAPALSSVSARSSAVYGSEFDPTRSSR
jgi:hypothetical protein